MLRDGWPRGTRSRFNSATALSAVDDTRCEQIWLHGVMQLQFGHGA